MDEQINQLILGKSNAKTTSIPLSKNSENSNTKSLPTYIPSNTWKGSKEGYYFGTTIELGTGYYLDNKSSSITTNNSKKRKTFHLDEDSSTITTEDKNKQSKSLLEEAEANRSPHLKILTLTKAGIQKSLTSLQASIEQNQIQRQEYATEPSQYLESELLLYEEIKSWKSLSSAPQLYRYCRVLIENFVTLLQMHENLDIGCVIMSVFVEILDLENGNEDEEADDEYLKDMTKFCSEFDLVPILLEFFMKIIREKQENEDEDGMVQQCILDCLTLLETFFEMERLGWFYQQDTNGYTLERIPMMLPILAKTKILSWMSSQILASNTGVTREKYQISELLFTILQQEKALDYFHDIHQLPPLILQDKKEEKKEEKEEESTIDCIDMLLQGIAPYRKKNPTSLEESEMLEHYCNALASICNSREQYKLHFLSLQGIELLIKIFKGNLHLTLGALKVLESCCSSSSSSLKNKACHDICNTFIRCNGLKYLFPLFMGRTIPKPFQKTKEWVSSLEQYTIQVLYYMTRFSTNARNDARDRFLYKFIEADCEKCHRLVELLLKYDLKQRKALLKFYKSEELDALNEDDSDYEDNLELMSFSYKLRHGGDLFHRIGVILAFVCVGSKRCHECVLEVLGIHRSGIGVVKAAIGEFIDLLEDGPHRDELMKYQDLI